MQGRKRESFIRRRYRARYKPSGMGPVFHGGAAGTRWYA